MILALTKLPVLVKLLGSAFPVEPFVEPISSLAALVVTVVVCGGVGNTELGTTYSLLVRQSGHVLVVFLGTRESARFITSSAEVPTEERQLLIQSIQVNHLELRKNRAIYKTEYVPRQKT